ncbi:MAG: type II toxin-antitoxin system RelE/ParE family toxin [Oscillospiraceae bacterium]|jgi:phage-related protein|nr:type II toxin-antitoxin system RelE/ParE family toxin [Oscillospiraceae bacterium]
MYKVIFYRDKNGKSEIVELLDELQKKSTTSKNERINCKKILTYIGALEQYGTRIGEPVIKHIDGNIWELRPLSNRIFFFYWKDNKYVLLHHFIKKTRKTPLHEIEQARLKLKDYIKRYGE